MNDKLTPEEVTEAVNEIKRTIDRGIEEVRAGNRNAKLSLLILAHVANGFSARDAAIAVLGKENVNRLVMDLRTDLRAKAGL